VHPFYVISVSKKKNDDDDDDDDDEKIEKELNK
jgi:hypothetical protein